MKATKAIISGKFTNEIIDIKIGETIFNQDEGVRLNPVLDKMSLLKPAFQENGKVTAGNSSQISDGAAALIVMEEKVARETWI